MATGDQSTSSSDDYVVSPKATAKAKVEAEEEDSSASSSSEEEVRIDEAPVLRRRQPTPQSTSDSSADDRSQATSILSIRLFSRRKKSRSFRIFGSKSTESDGDRDDLFES